MGSGHSREEDRRAAMEREMERQAQYQGMSLAQMYALQNGEAAAMSWPGCGAAVVAGDHRTAAPPFAAMFQAQIVPGLGGRPVRWLRAWGESLLSRRQDRPVAPGL